MSWPDKVIPIPILCPACHGELDRGFCEHCMARAEVVQRCRKCLARRIKWHCDRCNGTKLDPAPEGYIGNCTAVARKARYEKQKAQPALDN